MLDRDMGLLFDAHPPANFGLGEVIEGEPTQEEVPVPNGDPSCAHNKADVSFFWRFLSLLARMWKAMTK
ncbi:hypothetical protein DCAR_0832074 [Daucus carota subsp. sativus]|uniref:Uncharacterized protein n=1 Tax=Daucus carota subsp. sativus TaxID=79200 RepID=A0A175YPE5_DAUCS|nr:hypothetical protein DCAR_0832074 [Daucus carota subsp. sativus]